MRLEFGVERTQCACRNCQANCHHMPGFLIPADLSRMIPTKEDPFKWAEQNLLASPGAVAMKDMKLFRIHTLVPAIKADGSCIHLSGDERNGKCSIHENAPFGCAFFDCGPERSGLSGKGLIAVYNETPYSLYVRLWEHLHKMGRRQLAPELLRDRIKSELKGTEE